MIETTHNIEGKLTILKYDLAGNLAEERHSTNSITLQGRKLVADLFKFNIIDSKEDRIKRISTIHLGKSGKPFSPDQVSMQDFVGKVKISSVESIPVGLDRIKLRIIGELDTNDCNGPLQEASLCTEDNPPIMYNRVVFDTITKTKDFKLTLIWEITF